MKLERFGKQPLTLIHHSRRVTFYCLNLTWGYQGLGDMLNLCPAWFDSISSAVD